MDSLTGSHAQPIWYLCNEMTSLADAGIGVDIVYQDSSKAVISDIFLYIQSKTFVSIYISHHSPSYQASLWRAWLHHLDGEEMLPHWHWRLLAGAPESISFFTLKNLSSLSLSSHSKSPSYPKWWSFSNYLQFNDISFELGSFKLDTAFQMQHHVLGRASSLSLLSPI